MWESLLWAYAVNATLLIVHEIDSAYWKEWELFRLPGGPGGFVLLHIPMVLLVLWGFLAVARHQTAGLVLSLILAASGLVGFGLHTWFLSRGRPEFRSAVSVGILALFLLASLFQAVTAVRILLA
jgi:hypothetical protein